MVDVVAVGGIVQGEERRAMYSSRTRRRSTFSLLKPLQPKHLPPRSLLSLQPLERGTCAGLIAAKLITLSATVNLTVPAAVSIGSPRDRLQNTLFHLPFAFAEGFVRPMTHPQSPWQYRPVH